MLCITDTFAQHTTLDLDSCRTLATHNNKQILISEQGIAVAHHERKSAFANYLPKLSLQGVYIHNQQNTSLIDDEKKRFLKEFGTTVQKEANELGGMLATMFPELKEPLSLLSSTDIATPLNQAGKSIADALTLQTRNIYAAALTLTQPVFLGGKIVAYNNIAKYAEEIAYNSCETAHQETIVAVDKAYWTVVSLANKQRLAGNMVKLVTQLHDDTEKMLAEGMATRADLLNVNVKLNEAQIALLQIENGLSLARMQLSLLCGLPLNSTPTLADEETIRIQIEQTDAATGSIENRPELKSIENETKILQNNVIITRSDYLPQLVFTANYMASSPSLTNGFSKRLRGIWNIGVLLKIPLWNWSEGINKIKAAKAKTVIAQYTLDDVRDKMRLQEQQARLMIEEADKRLQLATNGILAAEENLRTAEIGFVEGVLTSEDVIAAQTAWLKAHSAQIDAHIDAIMSRTYLKRALGTLR